MDRCSTWRSYWRRVVIVVMLLTTALSFGLLFLLASQSDRDRQHASLDLRRLVTALNLYNGEFGSLPNNYGTALLAQNYVDPEDCIGPNRQPYSYSVSADRSSYTLAYLGADGLPGGIGRDADLPSSVAVTSPLGSSIRYYHAFLAISLLSFAAILTLAVHYVRCLVRYRTRLHAGLCPRCRYQLAAGGTVVCPECGWQSNGRSDGG